MMDLLNAPCLCCGYNGQGYWQPKTHSEKCPWYEIGGMSEREEALSQIIPNLLGHEQSAQIQSLKAELEEARSKEDQTAEQLLDALDSLEENERRYKVDVSRLEAQITQLETEIGGLKSLHKQWQEALDAQERFIKGIQTNIRLARHTP
jgi:chromosome segregation ATPase